VIGKKLCYYRNMPGRKTPLVTNHYYHVVNRTFDSIKIFRDKGHCLRAINLLFYYQPKTPPMRYSYFIRLPLKEQAKKLEKNNKKLVDIICFCFMPTHFHFLLKQKLKNGISTFLSRFTNSYTRYFNTKKKRIGPLFQGKFKAVKIDNEQQLLHVSRYIHLNPYSSKVVKNLKELASYPYSSLKEYLENRSELCSKNIILGQFSNKESYKSFVLDRAEYQVDLQRIKNLLLESHL